MKNIFSGVARYLSSLRANSMGVKDKRALAGSVNTLTKALRLTVSPSKITETDEESISSDPTVIQVVENRKAANLKKELVFDTKDEVLNQVLGEIFPQSVREQILDTFLQGMSVFELNWKEREGYLIPSIVERNYREFDFEPDGSMVFTGNGFRAQIPRYKAIAVFYRKKHNKPKGRGLYQSLYFSVKIKNAGIEFWIRFLEKFGSPWVIGRTENEKNIMADELYGMLAGDVAVIDKEDEVSIVAASKIGDFDKIVEYCDKQIAKLILGANLTSDVSGGAYAASQTHADVRKELADADANYLSEAINVVLKYFCEINNLPNIKATLKDKDDPNIALAERDERITRMGHRLTAEYIEQTYNVKLEKPTLIPNSIRSFSSRQMPDNVGDAALRVNTQNVEAEILQKATDAISNAKSYDEAIDALLGAYPEMTLSELEAGIEKAMLQADLYGYSEAYSENES